MGRDGGPTLIKRSKAKCCATCNNGMWEGDEVWCLKFEFWAKYHEYCEDYK
jgi:hypothetical protein